MNTEPKSSGLNVGTRGSPLALAQTQEVCGLLRDAHTDLTAPEAINVVEIKTTGDAVLDRSLADIGGKGLFSKEIDQALLDGRIDLAVHSMKDLETWMPDGIAIAAVLPREDPRDGFISTRFNSIDDLPQGACVGTSSVRRQAQLLHRRPDLKCVQFRGNVQTRLRKLADGQADATFLACAGLNRLGRSDTVTRALEFDEMLPAVAQGAVAVTCRTDDVHVRGLLDALNHQPTSIRVTTERAMLEALDGSCRTPVGGLAEIIGEDRLRLRGLVAREDGSEMHQGSREGVVSDARAMGLALGEELKALAGPGFFAEEA